MGIIQTLSSFALRQVAGESSSGLLQALGDRLGDTSARLVQAIRRANERAWKSVEIALAGESLWNRLDRGEDRAFRQQVRSFLDALPLPELTGRTEFRRECLRDVQDARRHGLLLGPIVAEELAESAGVFARFVDAAALLDAERSALEGLAGELERARHRSLAWLLRQNAQPGQSLVVVAVRFFFRREVESNPELARRLSFGQVEALSRVQEEGFQRLESALHQHGERLGEALDGLTEVVSDLRDSVCELSGQVAQMLSRLQPVGPAVPDGPERPAVPDLQVAEEILLPRLRGFLPQDDLHLAPDIPPKKLANACRVCQVPADEVIFALIDATVTGTAKSALLLGRAGIYYHNEHGAKVPGQGMIPYAALASRRIFRDSWSEVCLDRGEFFNRGGSQLTGESIIELLLGVQRALQQH